MKHANGIAARSPAGTAKEHSASPPVRGGERAFMCWYVAYCDGWRLDVPIQSPTDKAAATGMVARLRSVGYTVEEVGEVEDSDEVLSRDLRPVAD